jgi:D-3-phosphoglycerate dehydrogenase
LRGLENVILTPHVGGSTEEAQQDIGHFVAGKLRDYLDTGATTLSVNLPPVALPAIERRQRLLYLHHNTPGVLATVDGLLAEHSINIVGQLLATAGDYGYVVTDVAGPLPDAACEQLRALPVAVRLRIL